MGIRNHLTLLVVGASLAACGQGVVSDLNVRDWVGHNGDQLVQSWGAPHHSYATADGGNAIGYHFTNQAVRGPKGQPIFDAKHCMINFEIDGARTIKDATTTGTNCSIGPHDQMHPRNG